MSDYEDVHHAVEGATAVITIKRLERYNAFRGRPTSPATSSAH